MAWWRLACVRDNEKNSERTMRFLTCAKWTTKLFRMWLWMEQIISGGIKIEIEIWILLNWCAHQKVKTLWCGNWNGKFGITLDVWVISLQGVENGTNYEWTDRWFTWIVSFSTSNFKTSKYLMLDFWNVFKLQTSKYLFQDSHTKRRTSHTLNLNEINTTTHLQRTCNYWLSTCSTTTTTWPCARMRWNLSNF